MTRFLSSRHALLLVLTLALLAVLAACGNDSAGASGNGQTAGPTATAQAPTATPKPKSWVTVQHFSGSQDTQTATFHLADGARIVWTVTPTDTNANACSIELDNSDGTPLDLVANTANLTSAQTSTYNVHGDADAYLKISALFCTYDIAVQVYQ